MKSDQKKVRAKKSKVSGKKAKSYLTRKKVISKAIESKTESQAQIHKLLSKLNHKKKIDEDSWAGKFHDALKERIRESKSVEESILAYFTTSLLEIQVNNGGFTLAFMNLDPNWILFALKGYQFLGFSRSAEIVKKAIKTAKSEARALKEARKSIKNYTEYRQRQVFDKLDQEAWKKMSIPNKKRIQIVKKYIKDFQEF